MAENLDFNNLDTRISRYEEPIVLNNDVILGNSEYGILNKKYVNGIKVKSNVIIDGNGHSIDARGKVRIFNITGENVTIKNFNFKNGFTEKHGGAIRNAGKCKLINCTFENNKAKKRGNDLSNGNEMTLCNCKFSNEDAINNVKSIYVLEDEKEYLEPFISGGDIHLITFEEDPQIEDPFPVGEGDGSNVPGEDITESPDISNEELTDDLIDNLASMSEDDRETLEAFLKDLERPEGILVPGKGRLPFPAYEGEEDYIFISYAHKDSERVFSEIKRFYSQGYRVWYDEGINPGNEWKREIVTHLVKATLLVVFMTFDSVKSDNVKKEIFFAIHKNVDVLPIYLDDFDEIHKIMDLELEFELTNIQGILKPMLSDEEYVYKYTKAFKEKGFKIPEDLEIPEKYRILN